MTFNATAANHELRARRRWMWWSGKSAMVPKIAAARLWGKVCAGACYDLIIITILNKTKLN